MRSVDARGIRAGFGLLNPLGSPTLRRASWGRPSRQPKTQPKTRLPTRRGDSSFFCYFLFFFWFFFVLFLLFFCSFLFLFCSFLFFFVSRGVPSLLAEWLRSGGGCAGCAGFGLLNPLDLPRSVGCQRHPDWNLMLIKTDRPCHIIMGPNVAISRCPRYQGWVWSAASSWISHAP